MSEDTLFWGHILLALNWTAFAGACWYRRRTWRRLVDDLHDCETREIQQYIEEGT